MDYTIHVEGFGKIKKADIKVSPLTLLVGDNNSGKSYLLSLIWAFHSMEMQGILLQGADDIEEFKKVVEMIDRSLEKNDRQIILDRGIINKIFNLLLEKNKDQFVKAIFNSETASIRRLSISIENDIKICISRELFFTVKEEESEVTLTFNVGNGLTGPDSISSRVKEIFKMLLADQAWGPVYFPAARTGFLLAKDAINKAARRNAFDGLVAERLMEPFTKPIMNFLDVINDFVSIPGNEKEEYDKILEWVQDHMAHGRVDYQSVESRYMNYYPEGTDAELPLRAASAVVTELTPLMMLLRYPQFIDMICYEEPEMCLHPQLQLNMARLLIRLVKANVGIVAATHSDIILQHINNICRLSALGMPTELLSILNMTKEDCISIDQIAVYQLSDKGEYSEVKRLEPSENGFEIPTFKDALQDILNQTSEIYSYEKQGE